MSLWAALTRRRSSKTGGPEDVARELRSHLDLEIDARQEEGASIEDATRAAYRTFGNPTRIREDIRDADRWAWADDVRRDLRDGVRHLRAHPVFTTVACLSLALGLGANIAIFNVSSSLLRRDLPVPEPKNLVTVTEERDRSFSYPAYVALREHARPVGELMAASSLIQLHVAAEDAPAELRNVTLVSGNYFSGFRIPPAVGRFLDEADEDRQVAVVSYGFWTSRFAQSPAIVGARLTIGGAPVTVLGVAPPWFSGESVGEAPDLWASVAWRPAAMRNEAGFTWLYLMGRLRPQHTREELSAVLNTGGGSISRGDSVGVRVSVAAGETGFSRIRDRWTAPLTVLTAIVALLLVVTCVNLAALLLTRGAARQLEIAVRLSLGATRQRVVRSLLTEHLLLALLGGTIGLGLGVAGSHALVRLVSDVQVVSLDVQPRSDTLLFALVLSVSTIFVFGLIPAFRAGGTASLAQVSAGSRWIVGRQGRWGAREGFIVAQLAVSFVLLAAGTLFIQTLRNLQTQELGFETEHVLTVPLVPNQGYRPDGPIFIPRLLAAASALPGVQAATVAFSGVLSEQGGGVNGLRVPGFVADDPQALRARADWVGPDYFKTSGIRLVSGRDFSLADDPSSEPVAIVNEAWARHFFGTSDVVGRRFGFTKKEYAIVGVAHDAKYDDLRASTTRLVYFAALQGGPFSRLWLRTAVPPATLATSVRRLVGDVDSRVAVGEIGTVAALLQRKLARERLLATLAGVFSGLALILVSIGIYGTVAYSTAERSKEIGLRLALGSSRASVMWHVVRRVVIMLAAGLGIGVLGVYGAGSFVSTLLYGVSPMSGSTIATTGGVLALVALVAGYLPAIRAARFDLATILKR